MRFFSFFTNNSLSNDNRNRKRKEKNNRILCLVAYFYNDNIVRPYFSL